MSSSKTAVAPPSRGAESHQENPVRSPRVGGGGGGGGTMGLDAGLEDKENISSPHELTDWVDSLIDSLQSRFDVMGRGMDKRMSEMSRRIDLLESSIEELIQGHAVSAASATSTADQSAPAPAPALRKGSGTGTSNAGGPATDDKVA